MGQVKEINPKNRNHYFRDDTINIKDFHSNLLAIDKEIDTYNIGYTTVKNLMIVKIFTA